MKLLEHQTKLSLGLRSPPDMAFTQPRLRHAEGIGLAGKLQKAIGLSPDNASNPCSNPATDNIFRSRIRGAFVEYSILRKE
jgi:hypothetical protein